MVRAGAVGRCQTRPWASGCSPRVARAGRDVLDVRVAVRQVDVAERGHGLPGERGGEDRSAERGVEDAGPEEVGGTPEDDGEPALVVGSEVAGVELGAHTALAGGGVPRGVLGHHLAVRLPVRVERVEDDQPRALRVGGPEDRLLDPRHDLHLEVVADVDAVVHDVGPGHGRAGALRGGDIRGVPLDALDRGPVPRPVDQPDGPPPADQLAGEGGSGGS